MLALGKPHWLYNKVACDILIPEDKIYKAAMLAAGKFDYVLQPLDKREKRLLISDMDSTMIQQECIDELADLVGKKREVAAITERAMNGELDFKAALIERVALLKGLREEDLNTVYRRRIKLMPGARILIQTLKARGVYCLLVSGGFRFFTSRVGEAIGFHADEANELEIEGGVLTGRVVEPILDKEAKLAALKRIAAQKKIPLEASIAIGDGANDLPMLKAAGLGIAYHAKPIVRSETKASINFNDLSALLYVLGVPRHEWITS